MWDSFFHLNGPEIMPPWVGLPSNSQCDWKMNTVFLFLNNRLNQPPTEGHFVVIDSNCQDLLWRQSEDAGKFKFLMMPSPSTIHCPL